MSSSLRWVLLVLLLGLAVAGCQQQQPAQQQAQQQPPTQQQAQQSVETCVAVPHPAQGHGKQVIAIDPNSPAPAPDAHPAVQIHVDEEDTLEWCVTGDAKFKVKELKLNGPIPGQAKPPHNAPPQPFWRKFPKGNPKQHQKAINAGTAELETAGYEYKYTLTIKKTDGTEITYDPHIQFGCGTGSVGSLCQ